MGATWPNLKADRVEQAGYYWNERLMKLARLQVGEKLPRKPGKWDFIAKDDEGTSSEIFSKIVQAHPGHDINEFTFTVRSPVGRRLPLGDRPRHRILRGALGAAALIGAGAVIGRMAAPQTHRRLIFAKKAAPYGFTFAKKATPFGFLFAKKAAPIGARVIALKNLAAVRP